MSTNILDAFIITFGLDARGYHSGEREVRDAFKKTRENAKSTFDDIERRGKNAGQSLRSVRNEVVGLFLAFAGGKSIADFATNMIHSEAAASRLSETLGITAQRLLAWQQLDKQVGGTGAGTDAALGRIQSAIQNYRLTGTTGMDADLRGLGITKGDVAAGDPSAILLKMAEAGERLSKPEFAARLQRIGIPQSTIYVLERGRKALEEQLKAAEKTANVTDKDIESAKRFEAALARLQSTIQGTVRPALTNLVENLDELLDGMNNGTTAAPSFNDALVGLGVVAVVIGSPFLALAAAIALVVANLDTLKEKWNDWKSMVGDAYKSTDSYFDPVRKFFGLKTGAEAERDGTDIFGLPAGGKSAAAPASGAAAASGSAPASGDMDAYIFGYLKRSGYNDEQARGILAGIKAEGGHPTARNPTSGAFGIGQWLGARKRALFRKYGPNPSLPQQMEHLVSELKGGDRGGPIVGRQTTADHTLLAYVSAFMRPAPGRETLGDIRRGRQYLARSQAPVSIGTMNIHTQATDAKGIERAWQDALRRRGVVTQADSGVAP